MREEALQFIRTRLEDFFAERGATLEIINFRDNFPRENDAAEAQESWPLLKFEIMSNEPDLLVDARNSVVMAFCSCDLYERCSYADTLRKGMAALMSCNDSPH